MSEWMKPKRPIDRSSYLPYAPYKPAKSGPTWRPANKTEEYLVKWGIWDTSMDREKAKEAKEKGIRRVRGKGKATLLREAVLADAQDKILENLPVIIQKACDLAEAGDVSAMKLILDRIMPTFKQKEEGSSASNRSVTINITGTNTLKVEEALEGEIVNREMERINED